MCGIFGLIQKDGTSVSQKTLHSAINKLHHRGPDDDGFFASENIGLSHNRLSIIDLSEEAGQPFLKHNMVLTFNGEIYNYQELREELSNDGYLFRSNSDTEVIISGYHRWGIQVFNKMNGMWALAIFNQKNKNLLLSRDRYGMKPLYIYENHEVMSFSSEIKAFTTIKGWTGDLYKNSVKDYLVKGDIYHTEHSFYRNVRMINRASYSIIDLQGRVISQTQYYEIPPAKKNFASEDILYRSHFSEAVKRHHIADVPIALALSGGLDSSSIVMESLTHKTSLETFTYAPKEIDFNEYKYVEEVLKNGNIRNHMISPDFHKHIEKHKEALRANEAPLLSMSFISSYMLYEEVSKKQYKVLLAGQGADELLLGYNFYYLPFLKHIRSISYVAYIKEVLALIITYPKKAVKTITRGREADLDQFINFHSDKDDADTPKNMQAIYNHHLGSGQLHALLQFEDRVSMAHSVECRLPFLDKDFSNYLHKIPFNKKIKNGQRKAPLRSAMKGLVPKNILNRKDKMGFVSPEEKWIIENGDYFIKAIKAGIEKHPGWLKPSVIDFIAASIVKKEHTSFVWRIYSFLEFLDVKL